MTQHPLSSREAIEARLGELVAGRFRLARVLGAGGMGWVYLAMQEPLGRPVALKVLVHERDAKSFRQRFFLEASVAARLSSPHIVTIHDYGETERGELYIAMEYVHGISLSSILKREGPFEPERICRLMRQICKGLSVAHDAGVVHRDLKPSNIMLVTDRDGDESVKVLDFGLVKSFSDEVAPHGELTGAGMVLGSPSYMSPEQIRRGAVDQRTDIYALGVLIYRLLTGQAPFQAETVVEVMNMHLNSPPPPIDRFLTDPGLTQRHLEAVALRCLEKNPAARYASMDDLRGAVKSVERLIPPDPLAPHRRLSSTDARSASSDSLRGISNASGSVGSASSAPVSSSGGSGSAPHGGSVQPAKREFEELPTMSHSAFVSVIEGHPLPTAESISGPMGSGPRPANDNPPDVAPMAAPVAGRAAGAPTPGRAVSTESSFIGSGGAAPGVYTAVPESGASHGSNPYSNDARSVSPASGPSSAGASSYGGGGSVPASGSGPSLPPTAYSRPQPTRLTSDPLSPSSPSFGWALGSSAPFGDSRAAATYPIAPSGSAPLEPARSPWIGRLAVVGALTLIGALSAVLLGPPARPDRSSPPPERAEASPVIQPPVVEPIAKPVNESLDGPAAETGAELEPRPARRVVLALDSKPQGALVTLGSRTLGATPLTVRVPRTDGKLTLRFELDGYKRLEQSFDGQDDLELSVVLRKKPRRARARAEGQPVERDRAPPPPPADEATGRIRRSLRDDVDSEARVDEVPGEPPPPARRIRRKLKSNPYE